MTDQLYGVFEVLWVKALASPFVYRDFVQPHDLPSTYRAVPVRHKTCDLRPPGWKRTHQKDRSMFDHHQSICQYIVD